MIMFLIICRKRFNDKLKSKLTLQMTRVEQLKKSLKSNKQGWFGHANR